MHDDLRRQIEELPDSPGIYVFRGAAGEPLYVGKAKSLRKRVPSYLGRDLEPRLAAMVELAVSVECVATATEAAALMLENNWIKRHRPRYNVLLRDDKTFPYLKLTREPWPRLVFTRRIRQDGADYFGPYLPGGMARRALKLVQRLFGVRVCTIEIDGGLPRPCLYHDMKRCLGPCVAGLTSSAEYAEAVEGARLFLGGKTAPLCKSLRSQMESAADRLDFERAARLRDLLLEIERQSTRSPLSSVHEEDIDLFGVAVHGNQAAVSILVMRSGQVLDRREVFWEGESAASPPQLLSELLPQIYDQTTFLPKELHLPFEVDGEEALAEWMSERKGERVYLRHPERGPKAERLRIAAKDAEFAFRRRYRLDPARDAAPRALARHLGLAKPPRWIEGFDISNLQGTAVIASMVVWRDGRIRKGEYRSFNIRGFVGQDDFRSIGEAVERRYRRLREESGVFPDLVLIDGGRGQLGAAAAALAGLQLEELPLVALAKREEELYLPGEPEPLRLPRRDEGLRLLQMLRDEAHRFAVSKHRRQRTTGSLRSRLEEIPGVGPVRRKLLSKRYGTWEILSAAPAEELRSVLGDALGAAVYVFLHGGEPPGALPASGPSEPSQPSQPSEPLEAPEPSEPSEPLEGSDPSATVADGID